MTLHRSSPLDQSSLSARQALAHARIQSFIEAYRNEGYRIADIDPLGTISVPDIPALLSQTHALEDEDIGLAQHRLLDGLGLRTVKELTHHLSRLFCGPLALDGSGVRDEARRQWLLARMSAPDPGAESGMPERAAILARLAAAEQWEHYLQQDYPQAKRFSLEGCESLLLMMDALVERCSFYQLDRLFFAMPHRGRLNLLVNLLQMPAAEIVAYFDASRTTVAAAGAVDLPYHLGAETVRRTAQGEVALFLAHNPSHLESAYPVLLGMARGYRASHPLAAPPASVVIHGDAAFCGQGVVMESLKLVRQPGYEVGGTIHIIVNNQIGFTTPNPLDPENHGYCTDIARIVGAPVLHVNADQPEAVLRAARIAFDYRMQFHSDVVIDLVGYRRWGHAEQDTATVTQPLLHGFIDKHPSVTRLYAQAGWPGSDEGAALLTASRQQALAAFRASRVGDSREPASSRPASEVGARDTSLPTLNRLRQWVERMTRLPVGFDAHPVIDRLVAQWQHSVAAPEHACSWNFAENMAYASLLAAGHSVRISGMDVQRGTFMQRQAVWHAVDQAQARQHSFWPLREVAAPGAALEVINSPLSEEAVVGFEYGVSVQARPDALVIWEAQFGDFVNGAQIMIDQYITSGRGKWGYGSALTLLLPHGYEGVGPEHSTGYLSRMLLLCADHNIRVAYPSSSAQWFHLLRDQALQADCPLVVFTPKTVLHTEPRASSPLSALLEGAFQPLLEDPEGPPQDQVRRVVLCSGKVRHDLAAARDKVQDARTALLSVEQLYPFPTAQLGEMLHTWPALEEVLWVQEEERNQGAWLCVRDAIEAALPAAVRLRAVYRPDTASGPTASKATHYAQQASLMHAVFPQG
ncbi:MAG TPA: 2-oxoglutarate dehydrogenase E1 component [Herbaspirillum sp.]|uniref:2-oxoglutarate dehydrogenase E1 component n=1 Tax=Herbaspirillum sp. TaxID=1890675 RepID=UPI002D72C434|nr:2-oxoglutarate dehydrogenase E1 component [Herbaspirillum sp.]HZG19213.1 2-oxoglutarate dehydrogenase E1 component [Herbaspirillum sp.]